MMLYETWSLLLLGVSNDLNASYPSGQIAAGTMET